MHSARLWAIMRWHAVRPSLTSKRLLVMRLKSCSASRRRGFHPALRWCKCLSQANTCFCTDEGFIIGWRYPSSAKHREASSRQELRPMQGHRPRVPYMRKLFKLLFVELDPCLEPRPESEAIIDLAIDPCQPTGKTSSRPVTPATTMT